MLWKGVGSAEKIYKGCSLERMSTFNLIQPFSKNESPVTIKKQ